MAMLTGAVLHVQMTVLAACFHLTSTLGVGSGGSLGVIVRRRHEVLLSVRLQALGFVQFMLSSKQLLSTCRFSK
jgi:hypothetical protein